MKNELLNRIENQLANDYSVYASSPERPCYPTNDNQPQWFIATCDSMEDIDSIKYN